LPEVPSAAREAFDSRLTTRNVTRSAWSTKLREDGFAAQWRDELPHLRPEFRGAIFHPPDGSLQPGRFVRRLAEQAAAEGVAFKEHHRVASLDELDTEQIVIATDGSGRGLLPELDDAISGPRAAR
jgi:glycine/D-amino acid oxidase-like deaminating enzyme